MRQSRRAGLTFPAGWGEAIRALDGDSNRPGNRFPPDSRLSPFMFGRMPVQFVVGSRGEQLRIWVVSPGAWRARIDSYDLTAEGTFHERSSHDRLDLDAYFADLAAH
jgi:hypothetical protein